MLQSSLFLAFPRVECVTKPIQNREIRLFMNDAFLVGALVLAYVTLGRVISGMEAFKRDTRFVRKLFVPAFVAYCSIVTIHTVPYSQFCRGLYSSQSMPVEV